MASAAVVALLQAASDVPRTVRRHACIVYWMLRSDKALPEDGSAPLVAAACLLIALKERNRTHLRVEMLSRLTDEEAATVVSLELLFAQSLRHKVMLVEGCLRGCFRRLADVAPAALLQHREHVLRTALSMADVLYNSEACLHADAGAYALILVAAHLLGIATAPPDVSEVSMDTTRIIADRLLSSVS